MNCGWLERRRAEKAVTDAFLQAMTEYGIGKHADGKCPASDCPCEELADVIERRACEILGIEATV